ncbi:hypothetical protein I603_1066 [Erythrobacter dokdonensis DSW-74]|uniref:Uncharacterized protein n=1 Tax=Erythrobacter dokdonensis DSW-74 TaxID=1300349 RepID=A0A1A7BGF4_9SPHN|nr:hypothetical protein I603_1066 [Erythrobacter dokdonensis DSW-74]
MFDYCEFDYSETKAVLIRYNDERIEGRKAILPNNKGDRHG